MILRALYKLAESRGLVTDPNFPIGNVSWVVTVAGDGTIRGIGDLRTEDHDGKKKPRLMPRSLPIPYQRGRSGTKAPASFLVDNAKYVFGLPTPDKEFSLAEGKEKSRSFRDGVAACVQATGDEGVAAVLRALDDVAAGRQRITLPPDCKSNDQFAFVYEPDKDGYVHDRPTVRAYWRDLRQGGDVAPRSTTFRCLITGEPVGDPGNFPKVKNVPGGQSSGVALVSFNAPAFESYGLRGNENAPIARAAAEAAATALQRVVHPAFPDPRPGHGAAPLPRWHVRVGADTLVCYWAAQTSGDPFLDVLAPIMESSDPAEVGELFRSVWRGQPAPVRDAGAFYALTVSGAQGRLVVRDWFEDTVADVNRHVAKHFDDLAVVRNTPTPKGRPVSEHLPLNVLLGSLAPLGKRENVPEPLGAAFVRAALGGSRYPYALLQRAVERARAEAGRSEWADLERRDARAALIKAVLRRTLNREVTRDMDPENKSPGYLCGRLMAVIERLQQLALGDVNAGVVDRYFGAASATPRAVFVRLLRNAQHHARKAQDEPSTAGSAIWLKRQVDEISSGFDPKHNGFPAFLPLEEQGLFILGYHQQRHALWSRRRERTGQDGLEVGVTT